MKHTAPQQRKIDEDNATAPNKRDTVAVNMDSYVVVQKKVRAQKAQQEIQKIRQAMKEGSLPEGNVELAAMMGHAPSQMALRRPVSPGMSKPKLFEFLISDPNLKITINIETKYEV